MTERRASTGLKYHGDDLSLAKQITHYQFNSARKKQNQGVFKTLSASQSLRDLVNTQRKSIDTTTSTKLLESKIARSNSSLSNRDNKRTVNNKLSTLHDQNMK